MSEGMNAQQRKKRTKGKETDVSHRFMIREYARGHSVTNLAGPEWRPGPEWLPLAVLTLYPRLPGNGFSGERDAGH